MVALSCAVAQGIGRCWRWSLSGGNARQCCGPRRHLWRGRCFVAHCGCRWWFAGGAVTAMSGASDASSSGDVIIGSAEGGTGTSGSVSLELLWSASAAQVARLH